MKQKCLRISNIQKTLKPCGLSVFRSGDFFSPFFVYCMSAYLRDRHQRCAVDLYFGKFGTVQKCSIFDRCHMLADRDVRHLIIALHRIFADGRDFVDDAVFVFYGIGNLDGLSRILCTGKFNGRSSSTLGYFIVMFGCGKFSAYFLCCRCL